MIRYMNEGDLEQVCQIENTCFSRPWSRASFQKAMLDKNNVYVAAVGEDGRILGYCGIWGVGSEGQICNMAVEDGERNRGTGHALLEFSLEECRKRGMSDFTLEVRKGNMAARRLYEKMGFTCAGIRKNYYTMPEEDALIMWLHGPSG